MELNYTLVFRGIRASPIEISLRDIHHLFLLLYKKNTSGIKETKLIEKRGEQMEEETGRRL